MTGVFVMVVNTMSISVDVGRLLFVSPYLVGVVIVVCSLLPGGSRGVCL